MHSALRWKEALTNDGTGKDIDKFQIAKLTKQECKFIKAPAIKECPISLECKVKEIKELGSHHMFIAEIVNIIANDEIVEKGKINFEKANLLTYMGNKYYVANKEVGDRGICLKR